MSAGDGSVLGMHPIRVRGPLNEKFNFALLSDGYLAGDMIDWAHDAKHFTDFLEATPPFDDPLLRDKFNYFRVDIASTDRGADKPSPCFDPPSSARTLFDTTYCGNGQRRLLLGDDAAVRSVLNAQVPGWHQALVIVNDTEPGGSGGPVAYSAKAPGWELTAIHELGHSAFALADEYEAFNGCGLDIGHDRYTGAEPIEVNVTLDSNRATIEWAHLIDASTPMPTTANANCAVCDPQPNPVAATTVGAFEGAKYFHCGLYRPQFNCMMRNYAPFCPVCTEAIRRTLAPFPSSPRAVKLQRNQVRPLFDPTGTAAVTSLGGPLTPPGVPSPGSFGSSVFPRAPAGVRAAGSFGYRYEVGLPLSTSFDPGTAVSELSVDFGPIVPVDFDGTGLADMFLMVFGAGHREPSFVEQSGDRLTFTFSPPIPHDLHSDTLGLCSYHPPRAATATIRDAAGHVYSVPALVPDFPVA